MKTLQKQQAEATGWSRYPSFTAKQFDNRTMEHVFMAKLQNARDYARVHCYNRQIPDKDFKIVNRRVGDKPDGTHHYSERACGIVAESSRRRYIIVKSLLLAGFTRIKITKKHIEVDDEEFLEGSSKTPEVLRLD